MRDATRLAVLIAAVTCALAAAGCDDSSPIDDVRVTTPTVAPDGAVTIGKIDRFPGGTAVITSDHMVVSITCQNEQLILTTTAGVFTGAMPCDRMVPPEIVGRFVEKPITITIGAGRLKIENPEAGSLDFPATDVRQ